MKGDKKDFEEAARAYLQVHLLKILNNPSLFLLFSIFYASLGVTPNEAIDILEELLQELLHRYKALTRKEA